MIMKRELLSQNVHKAHLNDMKHNAYYNSLETRYKYLWNTISIHHIIVNYIVNKYT